MNKYIVAVFPDEKGAYQGTRALHELHDAGSITLWDSAVVQRLSNGTLEIEQHDDRGPLGVGVGALLGGLIGLFGGPAGALAGFAAGTIAGGSVDLLNLHLSNDFVDSVKLELAPGNYAVVGEISEEWIAPLDTRMDQLGTKVLREPKTDFLGHLAEDRVAARKREFADRKAELAEEKASKLEMKIASEVERASVRLERTLLETQNEMDATRAELKAKMAALQEQAGKASPDARKRIEARTAELQRELAGRQQKLENAYNLVWQAIHG